MIGTLCRVTIIFFIFTNIREQEMDIVAESIPRKLVTVLKLSSNKIHRAVYIECTGHWLDKICLITVNVV
jgi:hypothetical protein